MKKSLLIALIAVGALSVVPSAEAGRKYSKSQATDCEPCKKKEKPCEDCTEKTEHVRTEWQDCMVPGKRPVEVYKTTRTCVKQHAHEHKEVGEPVCAIDNE